MRYRRIGTLAVVALFVGLLAPKAEAVCKICQESQGQWFCFFTDRRLLCNIDGADCTMTLVSSCGGGVGGKCIGDLLVQGSGLPEAIAKNQKGTIWMPLRTKTDPLLFTELSFSLGRRIKTGKVLNQGKTAVAAYQLGVIAVERGKADAIVVPGPVTDLTVPMKPSETRGMMEQPLSDALPNNDMAIVAVYIKEVRFADGSTWQANTALLQSEVEGLVRYPARKHPKAKPNA